MIWCNIVITMCYDSDMKEANDQLINRELTVMEFFILALIAKAKLTSLYQFQQGAALQPGGIRPALKSLERFRLITRAEASTRRRRDLSLTPLGTETLNGYWQRSLRDYPDTESVLRGACVALLMGDSVYAGEYLETAAATRRTSADDKTMDTERLAKGRRDPLSTYTWMRTLSEARRRSAESEAFATLGKLLKGQQEPDVNH